MLQADTRRWDEHGFSLLESLLAVVVLGIIATAMVGGIATSITMSTVHRQEASANAVMVSAAEVVKHAPYAPCAHPPYSASTVLPPGWPAGAIVVSVQYWNPNGSFDSNCRDTTPFPMQLVTISVTSPGGITSASIAIVKRAP